MSNEPPLLEQHLHVAAKNSPPTQGAGFGIRLTARLIDTLFGFVVGVMAGIIGGVAIALLSLRYPLAEGWQESVQSTGFSDYTFGLIGSLLYHTFSEGIGTTTVGKLVCKLRVVQSDGSKLSLGSSFIRNISYFLDALFFGAVAYISMSKSKLHQRYGDVWAESIVVSLADETQIYRATNIRIIAGIILGTGLWAILAATGFVLKAF